MTESLVKRGNKISFFPSCSFLFLFCNHLSLYFYSPSPLSGAVSIFLFPFEEPAPPPTLPFTHPTHSPFFSSKLYCHLMKKLVISCILTLPASSGTPTQTVSSPLFFFFFLSALGSHKFMWTLHARRSLDNVK